MIVDTGPLVAAADRRDPRHTDAVRILGAPRSAPLRVPMLVIAEAAHLIGRRGGTRPELLLIASLATGELTPEPVHPADWERIAELVARYRDLPLGTVDASLVALAERLGETEVASFDRRDLGVVRPRHCEALTLLP